MRGALASSPHLRSLSTLELIDDESIDAKAGGRVFARFAETLQSC